MYLQALSRDELSVIGFRDEDIRFLESLSPEEWLQKINECPGLSEHKVLQVISRILALPLYDLDALDIDAGVIATIPVNMLFRRQVVPVAAVDGVLTVVVTDPFDCDLVADLEHASGQVVSLAIATGQQIRDVLKGAIGLAGGALNDLMGNSEFDERFADTVGGDDLDASALAEESSVVALVNEMLQDAAASGASDLHIEPAELGFGVRYRIDGLLLDQTMPADVMRLQPAIVSRLKIMGKLNVAERRLPQDGRFKFTTATEHIDVRLSTIPMIYGESVVLRLLRQGRNKWGLDQLNISESQINQWRDVISQAHGIFLVTGPTGSGKTTTLYHVLAELRANKPEAKIITIEDPVEYSLPGVHQIQVNEATGLTFATGLRSILRHDPDIILLGEIRDQVTARHAIEAALTGHLVLASLHTNNAPGAFTRLIDMGIEPYLVSSTVVAAAAQRLVRTLCVHCRKKTADADLSNHTGNQYEPTGCNECRNKGYSGRMPIMELLVADEKTRTLCNSCASSHEIGRQARDVGMQTLWDVGQLAVATGHTTQEELSRVLGVDGLSPAEVPAASPLLTGGFETDSEQSAGTPV
jgi:general secretion pathway protein E/type IV pilus assembly protein PilB